MEGFQLRRNDATVTLVGKYEDEVHKKALLRNDNNTDLLVIPTGVVLTQREENFIEEHTEFTLY